MEKSDRIYIAPRRRPMRLPPDYHNPDKLDSERMLAVVVIGIIAVGILGSMIWLTVRHGG